MNKRVWILAGALTVALVGTAVAAEARGMMGGGQGRGPGMMAQGYQGQGMMGQGQGMMGQGQGMMGGRGMMGQGPMAGAMPCQTGGTFDPAVAVTQAESMLAQHKANLDAMQAQLDAATNDQVKANLTIRLERQAIMTGHMEAHLAVLKTLTAETGTLQVQLAMAQAEVDYFSKATATDPNNQAFITARLTRAQERVEWIKAEIAKQTN